MEPTIIPTQASSPIHEPAPTKMFIQWQFVPGPTQLPAPILEVVPTFLQGSAPMHEPASILPADSSQGESPIQLSAPMLVATAPIQAFSPRQEFAPIEASACWQAFSPTQASAPRGPFEKSQAFTPMQLFAPMDAVEQKQESSTSQAPAPIVGSPTLLHTRTSALSALTAEKRVLTSTIQARFKKNFMLIVFGLNLLSVLDLCSCGL